MDAVVLFQAAGHADAGALPIVPNACTGQMEHEKFAVMVRDVCKRTVQRKFNCNNAYRLVKQLSARKSRDFVRMALIRAHRLLPPDKKSGGTPTVSDDTIVVKLKRVPPHSPDPDKEFAYNMFETHFLDLLCRAPHPNVVRYYGAWAYEKTREIFIEMEDAGEPLTATLEHYEGRVPEHLMAWFMRQALAGLAYIHANAVVHCDIKGDNMMVRPDGRLVIADFGMCQETRGPYTPIAGDLRAVNPRGYLPFELLVPPNTHGAGPVTAAVDIFALGCVFVSGLMGLPCRFDTIEISGQMEHMAQFSSGLPGVPGPVPGLAFFNNLAPTPALANLLERMLHWDSRRRIIAPAAVQHPYFHTVAAPTKSMLKPK